MKYMVSGSRNLTPMDPAVGIGLFQAAKAWMNAGLADGTLDCQYTFADLSGGCAITNADSHEEAHDRLVEYPLFPFFDWDVTPLCDWSHNHDKLIEFFQKLAGWCCEASIVLQWTPHTVGRSWLPPHPLSVPSTC